MVNSTSNVTSSASSTGSSGSNAAMGETDFLQLMIQELKNQDPMNPMDGTQYASQLAQFSSLEQLTNLNNTMTQSVAANASLTQSVNNMMVSNLIGKETKLSGSDIQVNGQTSIDLGYNLPSQASQIQVNILNSNGAIIKSIDGSSLSSGDSKLSWDLTDNNGNKVSNGNYTFQVAAEDANGQSITSSLFKYGTIDGVMFNSTGTTLLVDGAQYNISEITEITDSGTSTSGSGH
jgi:flagellar basal-body rod modification protein FlgD